MPTDFLTVLCEFQERKNRYVLVGGLAVLPHGVDRLTADIDPVVDLAPAQTSRAVEILPMPGRSCTRTKNNHEPGRIETAAKFWQLEGRGAVTESPPIVHRAWL